MLKDFFNLKLPDLNGKNDINIQVNWNLKDSKTNNCQVVKFVFPDKSESYIKKEDLNFFLFAIGKADEQRKMIPQTITTVRKYRTILGIEAKKDIKKGEKINCLVEIPLPAIVENIVAEVRQESKVEKTSSGLIIPKSK